MSSFSVGDKVRYIKHDYSRDFKFFEIGKIYNVQSVLDNSLMLEGSGLHVWPDQLVKVQSLEEILEDCEPYGDVTYSSPTGSLRKNEGKAEVSQLDPQFLLDLADLMTTSAKKYGKFNWALGQEFHTPFDSCQRHLLKFMSGEDLDEESGKSHLIHAAANIMILYRSYLLENEDLDTRYNWNPNGGEND